MSIRRCVLSIGLVFSLLLCTWMPASAYVNGEDAYIRVGFNGACAVGVIAGTTAGELELSLEGAGLSYVSIRNADGTSAASGDTVYTGMTARVNKTYYIKVSVYGDVDGDGSVTVSDVTALSSLYGAVNNNEFACAADMDFNGTVSVSDKFYLRDYISGGVGIAAFISTKYDVDYSKPPFGDNLSLGNVTDAISDTHYKVSVSSYLNQTPQQVLNIMQNSSSTAVYAHGYTDNIDLYDYYTNHEEDNLSISDMNALSDNALADNRLIYYSACLTGSGGETADNLVNATYAKGAQAVIGYQVTVYTTATEAWNQAFYEALYKYGCTIDEAMTLADGEIANLPNKSCNLNRLVVGDTSQRLAHMEGVDAFETTCTGMISLYSSNTIGETNILVIDSDLQDGKLYYGFSAENSGYVDVDALRSSSSDVLSSENRRSIAINVASAYIDTDMYAVSEGYIESTGIVYYDFIKQTNGYDTSDRCNIMMKEDGTIVSVHASNTGSFDQIVCPTVSEQTIQEYILHNIGEGHIYEVQELRYDLDDAGNLVFAISVIVDNSSAVVLTMAF